MIDPLSDAAFEDLNAVGSDEEKKLRVTFFNDEIKDDASTAKEGRPIYRTVEMCEIRIPGDRDNIVVGRVTKMSPDPRERFPAAYARFQRKQSVQVVGTPLRKWGLIETTEARSYEDLGIVTVEQLAELSDANCQQLRGSLADRQKARDFLAQAKGQAPVAAARAELAAAKSEIEALKEQIAALGGKVQPTPEAPKRRGRPPKAKPAEGQGN